MSSQLTIAVTYESAAMLFAAQRLALSLQLPLVENNDARYHLLLVVTSKRLELRQNYPGAPGAISVDFSEGKTAFRASPQNLKNELIVRAVQVKGQLQLSIIDATAGLGRDAFILASAGHKVRLLERSPLIAALLADGITRLKTHTPTIQLDLTSSDAISYLQHLPTVDYPDVIYLDPMFPERTKSALVKKEMRLLQQLAGQDLDAPQLFAAARAIAKHKVVVKRPKTAPYLAEAKPTYSLAGKVGRFDVYI